MKQKQENQETLFFSKDYKTTWCFPPNAENVVNQKIKPR